MTRLTLYQIAGNEDIVVTHGGPANTNGKYAGWITFGEEQRFRPILSTTPRFDTPEEADSAMKEIVEFAKTFTEEDLKDPNNPLVKYFSPDSEEGQVIRKIALCGVAMLAE